MKFTKIHGCGNDYLYVDCISAPPPADPATLARAMSDRHFGVGSDGLILALPGAQADVRMRMFNADGSEGAMCGNGIRGLAKFVFDRGLVPAAKSLFHAFVATWRYLHTGGRITRCEWIRDFDSYDVLGTVPMVRSKVRDRFKAMFRSARQSILLTMAYFAPDDGMVNALCSAARRGVAVKLCIPAKSDLPLLTTAARSFYERMLLAGVQIYERQHVILHSKTLVVDECIGVIGSTNLDYRSIEYNCELSIVIRSPEFGEKMRLLFENDVRYSKRIILEQWRHRGIRDRVGQWAVKRARYLL